MTKKELEHISEIISAYAKDTTIEVVGADNTWRTLEGELDIEMLSQYPNSYRVKSPAMFKLNTWYYSNFTVRGTNVEKLYYFTSCKKYCEDTEYIGTTIGFHDGDHSSLCVFTPSTNWEYALKDYKLTECNNPKGRYESFLRITNKKLFEND